ncbi:uncharacterized protein LOC111519306 isoform X1 [Drosophila willistoni]|uniref:uncharacterized protein LOC111519306 isoform X1 n=1 Tax=Drosophila willistoni TaxID=7260 RepID=UPI000C26CA45|nr:uncharacterized protein LOC111519306 isoform X1 [Drosophila willistoni]
MNFRILWTCVTWFLSLFRNAVDRVMPTAIAGNNQKYLSIENANVESTQLAIIYNSMLNVKDKYLDGSHPPQKFDLPQEMDSPQKKNLTKDNHSLPGMPPIGKMYFLHTSREVKFKFDPILINKLLMANIRRNKNKALKVIDYPLQAMAPAVDKKYNWPKILYLIIACNIFFQALIQISKVYAAVKMIKDPIELAALQLELAANEVNGDVSDETQGNDSVLTLYYPDGKLCLLQCQALDDSSDEYF